MAQLSLRDLILSIIGFVLLTSHSFARTKNSTAAKSKPSKAYLYKAIEDAARSENIPAELLLSVCFVESGLRPTAYVHSDGGNANHAFGMCQVLEKTSASFVKIDEGCQRDFRDKSLDRNYKNCKLFGPRTNARVAAKYLKQQIKRYNGDLFKATAAYNTGSVRICGPKGWVLDKKGRKLYTCVPGDLLNRTYINRVKVMMVSERDNANSLLERDISDINWINRSFFPESVIASDIAAEDHLILTQ